LSDFEGWGNDVQAILRMMKSTDIWALFDHPPARTYYRAGRICLLGDCAHASTPHQGSGAGMAIEDALVLSQLLGQVQEKTDLQKAFKAYDAVRRPRTQKLVSTSRDAGCLYEFQKESVRDDVEALRNNLEGRMRWVWDIDLEEHLQEAMRIYRE
jgi:salicylate hydroxylase